MTYTSSDTASDHGLVCTGGLARRPRAAEVTHCCVAAMASGCGAAVASSTTGSSLRRHSNYEACSACACSVHERRAARLPLLERRCLVTTSKRDAVPLRESILDPGRQPSRRLAIVLVSKAASEYARISSLNGGVQGYSSGGRRPQLPLDDARRPAAARREDAEVHDAALVRVR